MLRLAASLAALTAPLAAPAMAASFDGRYSNVCMSRETGDLGGLELELRSAAADPVIIFKVCEGGCWATPIHSLSLQGDKITFVAIDEVRTLDGKLDLSRSHTFSGVFRGSVLKIGSPGYWERETLSRQRPYPAELALQPSEAPLPIKAC